MKLYGAIDLHSTNNVTVVVNEQDQVVYQKRLPQRSFVDRAATVELSQIPRGDRSGVDLQLVLAG